MTARHALLLLALPLHAAIGQVTQAGTSRDKDLERRVETRREELQRFIVPAVWQRVEGASRSMQERIRAGGEGDLVEYARKQVTTRLGRLKPAQTDLLAFCILAETARTLSRPTGQDSALAVNSQVDVLQSAALQEALNKDGALMSAARQMLQWTEREGPEILLTVKN
jgi:hypothetical protein